MSLNKFLDMSDSLQTGRELLRIIWQLSDKTVEGALKIWAAPTTAQMISIIQTAIDSGIDVTEICWGASGSRWANN